MHAIFEHTLLVSDIDGTLSAGGQRVPARNVEAIRRYCALGGRFAFATGRAHTTAGPILRQLQPNAPCIFINGTELYDTASGQTLAQVFLPGEAHPLLRDYYDRFPDAGMLLFTPRGLFRTRSNGLLEAHDRITGVPSATVSWADFPPDVYKALFTAPAETVGRMQAYYAAQASPLVEGCRSWPEYFELMPAGANKGTGLTQLRLLLGIPQERTFAIGDFDNDIPMLQAAGVSAAPANATPQARSSAEVTVCGCEEGAVAAFLDYLEHRAEGSGWGSCPADQG